jgi:hypothetical protein
MNKLIFHHNADKLPNPSNNLLPVQLYGINDHISYIGNSLLKDLKQKGVQIPIQAMDFLSIALAVTAADTFVQRKISEDGWSRQFVLELPLCEPERWENVRNQLEKTLYFLSGDTWSFNFMNGGMRPPVQSKYHLREKIVILENLDCVTLFSGGLDSAIGAIDILKDGHSPLLVSHAYKGDKLHQNMIQGAIAGRKWHYQFNADPHSFDKKATDISMRTRSFNFIAFGILSVCILQSLKNENQIELIIPENGFISLNAPLTLRRIGSLSTRTTHPFFINSIKEILQAVELPYFIRNPYQFMTKGEMVANCKEQKLLEKIVDYSVSCSHWHRKNTQCGICVPCLVRRAALFTGNIKESIDYQYNSLSSILRDSSKNDDIQSLMFAVSKLETSNIKSWILNSATLHFSDVEKYAKVFRSGLLEVKNFLSNNGIAI